MAMVKLGDVAIEKRETCTGSTQGVPIIGLEHLVPGEITLSSWDSDTDNTFSKMFRKDQVLLGRRRVYLKKAVIAPFDGICSGDITVIEAIPGKISPRLLPFIIQNERFFDYAIQGSAGSLSPRVKWEHLKDYEFNLSDYEEQESLANKLWSALKLKESYHALLLATDEMVKSRFIAQFENSDYMRYSFDDICYDDTKSATKIPASEYLTQGSYPIYDQATDSIIAGYSNDSNGVNMAFPAVLFGDHSRVVKYIDRAFYIGADGVKILRPISAGLSTEFLYYQLKFKDVPNTGYNRHFKYLKLFSYCCPNADEQRAFLAICHQADKSKFELKQAIEKIDKVMRALLQ